MIITPRGATALAIAIARSPQLVLKAQRRGGGARSVIGEARATLRAIEVWGPRS